MRSLQDHTAQNAGKEKREKRKRKRKKKKREKHEEKGVKEKQEIL